MRRRIFKTLTAGVLAALLLAFVVVPFGGVLSTEVPAEGVDRITVTGNGGVTLATVTDPEQVQEVVAFVHARRRGWRKTWHTFPTPGFQVSFESQGEFLYVLWVGRDGANWIGFRGRGKSSADNVLRNISAAERSELLRMLGL